MRLQTLLVTLLFAAIALLSAGLFRAQRQISALRQENAVLMQATSARSQPANDDVTEAPGPILPRPGSEQLTNDKQTQLLAALRAENAALRQRIEKVEQERASSASNAASPTVKAGEPEAAKVTDEIPSASAQSTSLSREQIEAYLCANHIHQITLATAFWAQNHNGFAPTNIVALREYLAPMILVCPSAKPKSVVARDWSKFELSTITYRFRLGIEWDFPFLHSHPGTIVYVWCPIHETASFNRAGHIGIPGKFVPR